MWRYSIFFGRYKNPRNGPASHTFSYTITKLPRPNTICCSFFHLFSIHCSHGHQDQSSTRSHRLGWPGHSQQLQRQLWAAGHWYQSTNSCPYRSSVHVLGLCHEHYHDDSDTSVGRPR